MMVPTTCRTSSTGSNKFSWIVVIVVSGLVSRTACMKSVTCVGNRNCRLRCGEKGIRLIEYGYSNSKCNETFSKEHAYHLYQKCSGFKRCSVKARPGNLTCDTMGTVSADSNIVKYQCVTGGNAVQFCKQNEQKQHKNVNIFFNDDVVMKHENHMCTCTINATEAYSITMEDIRPHRPDDTTHCSSAIIDNFDKKCNDSNKVWENFVYRKLWNTKPDVIRVKNLFAQGKDDRPTMIWIRVNSSANVQVKCKDAVQGDSTPTVGSPSATKPSSGSATSTTTKHSSGSASSTTSKPSSGSASSTTSKPSSGSATSTATKSSIGSATSTTTKPSSGSATSTTTHSISTNEGTSVGGTISSSSVSPNHARFTEDDNKVPVAAIVVPLLLVLLGSAAAVTSVWFWRNRRKAATGKNTNISNGQHNVTYVSSRLSSSRISGTDGTYDLPEEDEYSTIDGNGLAKPSCESDNEGYAVPADAVRADHTTEYDVATLQSKHVLLDPSYARLQGTSTNKVLSTQADDYSHFPLTTRSAQLKQDSLNDGSYSHLQGPPTATEYSHINDSDATCSRPTGWMAD